MSSLSTCRIFSCFQAETLLFWDSRITAEGDCSHEIKRCLLLGRKAMTSLDSLLKSRDMTLPTKVHLVKAMVFLVVMCGCESWTIKKAKRQRIEAFELLCWRRLLRVPWTARKSNLSILKEISPEYSLEGLMPKLKLQYFGHWCKELTHWKRPWCWERLKAGGEGDNRGWDSWMASLTWWTWVWASSGSWWWTGKLGVLQSMGSQKVGHDWATELNWTEKKREKKEQRIHHQIGFRPTSRLNQLWEVLCHIRETYLESQAAGKRVPGTASTLWVRLQRSQFGFCF